MTKTTRAARPLVGTALASLVLLAAACGSSPSSGSPGVSGTSGTSGTSGVSGAPAAGTHGSSALEKTTIVVGTLPVIDVAPLYLAIKNGYFAKQGLTVKTLQGLQSTAALPDLLHGTVDIIGGGNYTSYFEGDSRKTFSLDVVGEAINCVPGDFEILTLPGSGITSAAKLAGKTVAVNLTNNVQTLATDAILKADHVTGKPTYVAIPFPNMAAALKAHQVDAISVVEPFVSAALHGDGAVPVMSECQGLTAGLPLSGYFATAAWVRQYPSTARAFERGLAQAQVFANANPAAVKAILPSYTKITAAAAAHVVVGTFPASIEVGSLQALADLMLNGAMLTSPLDVTSIVFR